MFKWLSGIILHQLIPVLLIGCMIWLGWQLLHPGVGRLAHENPAQSALMKQRQKQWQAKGLKRRLKHTWVPLKRISPYLTQAVLIAEDDKFYSHQGFDWDMIQKAFWRNLSEGGLKFGASTITQQLAKNLFLTQDKSLLRKLREALLTWRLEHSLSKNRILELYLNLAEWGPGHIRSPGCQPLLFRPPGQRSHPGPGRPASRGAAQSPTHETRLGIGVCLQTQPRAIADHENPGIRQDMEVINPASPCSPFGKGKIITPRSRSLG